MPRAAALPWHRAPSLPVTVLLAAGPALAVAQFRALAPAVTLAFLLAVAAHWRAHRALPLPRATPALALAGALLLWAGLSSSWAPEPARALGTVAQLGALLVLGALAARAVAMDDPAHLRRMGPALAGGLALAAALLLFDHLTDNLFRRAVRGFPPQGGTIGFGLKPAASFLALLLPLVLAAPGVAPRLRLLVAAAGLLVAILLPGETAKIAALLGLAAAFAATFLRRPVAAACALLLALFFLVAPLLLAQGLARGPDLSALPRSAAHRVLIWDFVTARIADRPAIGWGMEASRAIPGGSEGFAPPTLARFGLVAEEARAFFAHPSTQRLPLHPHSAPLQVWLELGAVGAVLAAALAAALLLGAAATPVAGPALGAAVSAAVTALLSFGAWQPWWVASLLLAAAAVAGLSATPRR